MVQEYLFLDGCSKDKLSKYRPERCSVFISNLVGTDSWVLKIEHKGENEETAKYLSEVNDYVKKYNPTVLVDGCSSYFNKALYPLFNEFERKLRNILYLKSALSENQTEATVIKALEEKTLGEVFDLLFSDEEFIKEAKKAITSKSWKFTKKEVLQAIEKLEEKTLWDGMFDHNAVYSLRSDFSRIKDYRNDVMHAHSMDYEKYKSALLLVKKVNDQLTKELRKVYSDRGIEQRKDKKDTFNYKIGKALYDSYAKDINEKLININYNAASPVMFEELRKALENTSIIKDYKPIEINVDFSREFESISQLAEMKKLYDAIGVLPALNVDSDVSEALKSISNTLRNVHEASSKTADDSSAEPHDEKIDKEF